MADQRKNSKSHTIRLPLNIWEEIQERAEITDRSINYIVNKMLQKQLEQEKKNIELQTVTMKG